MKFKDIAPGTPFRVPSPWANINSYSYIKAISNATHLNAVHVGTWRAGTLDYVHDDTEVVVMHLQLMS